MSDRFHNILKTRENKMYYILHTNNSFDVRTYFPCFLTLWCTSSRHNVLLATMMYFLHFLSSWRRMTCDILFDGTAYFFMLFDIMMYFFTSWRNFLYHDVLSALFVVMMHFMLTDFLTLWPTFWPYMTFFFKVMTHCLLFDVMPYSLSWRLYDVIMYFFIMSWRIFYIIN